MIVLLLIVCPTFEKLAVQFIRKTEKAVICIRYLLSADCNGEKGSVSDAGENSFVSTIESGNESVSTFKPVKINADK